MKLVAADVVLAHVEPRKATSILTCMGKPLQQPVYDQLSGSSLYGDFPVTRIEKLDSHSKHRSSATKSDF